MAQYGGAGIPPAGGLVVLPAGGAAVHLGWMILAVMLMIGGLFLVRVAMVERDGPV